MIAFPILAKGPVVVGRLTWGIGFVVAVTIRSRLVIVIKGEIEAVGAFVTGCQRDNVLV